MKQLTTRLDATKEIILRCSNCKCQVLPSLSKAEPVGVPGPVKATCVMCGKYTARYDDQADAVFAWVDGKWDIGV